MSINDHSRSYRGRRYVYPVVSRRSRGVSIGINLNTNNACNWQCVYCQVPNLIRGTAPPIDLPILEAELEDCIHEVQSGQFMTECIPAPYHQITDIAFSGNGEPTLSGDFLRVVKAVVRIRQAQLPTANLVLITNGSLIPRAQVRESLREIASVRGEVWFKLDRSTKFAIAEVNQTAQTPERSLRYLMLAAQLCPTWVQTCMFAIDGRPPDEAEIEAYLQQLSLAHQRFPLRGVQLYGLARPSMQPQAMGLTPLASTWMAALAAKVSALGLRVSCVNGD